MYTILVLLKKEFRQIFRNKSMLPLIFVLPVVQLLVLVFAATLDIRQATMVISDKDNSVASHDLVRKFESTDFFTVIKYSNDEYEQNYLFDSDKADIILKIPSGFEKNQISARTNDIQVLINAVNSSKAGVLSGYIASIIQEYNKSKKPAFVKGVIPEINVVSNFWYNKELDYHIYMVPGILVVLVTVIGMFLTALNVVREKEIGTAEQINVTPIKRYHFLIGKLLPFWIIAMFELAFGLTIGVLVFNLPIVGSLGLLFGFAAVYLLLALGIGLLLSTVAETQQQVMFLAYFFILTFIIMSGIFTPVDSMPVWGQYLNYINPIFYFMKAIRMILLTGSHFEDLLFEFICMIIYALAINTLAVLNYRKTN